MVRANKRCLLVVDDEADLVQSVKDLLRLDYRVLTATRAAEGLNIMQREKVHVVMTDQRMPEMTGVEFLQRLRESFPDTVRLLFTAYADLNAVTDAINQGNVYRYISKPWQPDELRGVLRQAVDYYDLNEERRELILQVQQKNVQLEAANEELRRANDLKRAFIRVASHELRTPLTIVMGLSELAMATPGVQSPVKGWIEQVHRAGTRLNERVDQVTKMLMAEQFERHLQAQETSLARILREAAADVASFVEQRRQTLHLDFSGSAAAATPNGSVADDLGATVVEPSKLRDSVIQLLMNAIKFTPDGGVIRLGARRLADGGAEITVADTGIGIDAACLPRIFDPFFTRYDVSRHCSGDFEFNRRGLGLGLSMVKLFIEMHGGRVDVRSEMGKGTTFTIVLPQHRPSAA